MKSRLYTIFPSKSFTASTTEVIDLKTVDAISQLLILVAFTNASATLTAHPCALISKVEIVDGSDVLYSLDGY